MDANMPPTAFKDLPLDVLGLILSKIDNFRERLGPPPRACTALRAAARPPSLAWQDVTVDRSIKDKDNRIDLLSMLATAGTAVRRLSLFGLETPRLSLSNDPAETAAEAAAYRVENPVFRALEDALASTCPHLEELALCVAGYGDSARPHWPGWLAGGVATARRLKRLRVGGVTLDGLPGLRPDVEAVQNLLDLMAAAATGATLGAPPDALENMVGGAGCVLLSVHRAVLRAAAARPIRLTSLGRLCVTARTDAADVRGFTDVVGASLARLTVEVMRSHRSTDGTSAALATLVSGLPELADLTVVVPPSAAASIERPGPAVALDLRSVPPHAVPRLTRLSVRGMGGDLLLPPAMAGRLACLRVGHDLSGADHPPRCLRAASGCGPFTQLTRLVYCGPCASGPSVRALSLNLAVWGQPEFSIPSLRTLEAWSAWSFTLENYTGPGTWAEAVATRVLPNLARLDLVHETVYHMPPGACPRESAVEEEVVRALPTAAAAARGAGGQRMAVHVRWSDYGYDAERSREEPTRRQLGYEC